MDTKTIDLGRVTRYTDNSNRYIAELIRIFILQLNSTYVVTATNCLPLAKMSLSIRMLTDDLININNCKKLLVGVMTCYEK